MFFCREIIFLSCLVVLASTLNVSISLGIQQDVFSVVFADPTTTLSKSWLCLTEGFQEAACDTVISAVANATSNATNSTTSSLSFFAEVILIDPLHTTVVDLQRIISDRNALSEIIAQYSTWPAHCGLIDVCATPNASDSLKSCLQQRTFSGPLNYTNNLNRVNRVFANSDSRVLERLTPIDAIPFQIAVFAPVNQSICFPASTRNESIAEKFKSNPILYAALPGNFSRDYFSKEIQAETFPRGAIRLNCTTPLSWEGPKDLPSSAALRSWTEISGEFLETLSPLQSNAPNNSSPVSQATRRYLPRRDSDWSRSTLPAKPLAVLPEMFDWNMTSVALFDRAVDIASSQSNTSFTQRFVLGGNASSTVNASAAPSIQMRTIMCYGMTWTSAYMRWPNSSIVTAPQRTTVVNGSNATSSSGSSRLVDVQDRCIKVPLNASSASPAGIALPPMVLSMCPSTSTVLLPQFYVCSMKRLSMPFEVVLSPLGSNTTRNSSSGSIQQVTAASLQQNVSLLVAMMAEISAADGTIRRTAPNNSPVLTPTSNYSNFFSVNLTNDAWANTSVPWNPFTVTALQPQNCFPYAYVLPMPLKEAKSSASTLHNTSSAFPGVAAVTLLRDQFGVGSFCFASNLLLRATPLDGYCGDPWITGLYAAIEQTGLVVAFHRRSLSNLSALYKVSSIQTNVTGTCCTASYGGNTTSHCLDRVNSSTILLTRSSTECSSPGCTTSTTTTFQPSQGSFMSFEGVRKLSGVEATITAVVSRCSYDVYHVRRNCTPAVGAYVQMTAIPPQQSDALLSDYAAFDTFVRSSAYRSPFAGLSLVLTNSNGTAVFKDYLPSQCFSTRRAVVHFPMQGESTASINISDAAVTSYYIGISRFETNSTLYLLSRPSPGRCTGVLSQSMVNGMLGVPFGPLDVDNVDSCGAHLNGVVKLRAYASTSVLINPGVGAVVSPTALQNSTSLLGVLLRPTVAGIDNQKHIPALFAGITATNNLSNTVGTSGLMADLFMNSDALASMGDVILWSDLDGIPAVTASRLNSSCGGNATFLVSNTSSASTMTQMINASCGVAQVPVLLVVPPKPVVVEVAFSTQPAIIYANTLASTGAVLTVTFDVNCVNPNIATPSALAGAIKFTSSSPPPMSRRGFVYTQSQGYVSFSSVRATETTIDASVFVDEPNAIASLSSPTLALNQTLPVELHSISYSLTIFVAPNSLFNNYRKETVIIELTNELLTSALEGTSPAFALSNSTLSLTIFPNSRPLIDQAVMWLNFLTMTGFVIRTSSIVALQHSTSCIVDAGDSLDLTIHPLSFGVGSTDLTKFYLGGVLGNTALIVLAFVAQFFSDSLFALKMEKGATGLLDVDNPDSFKGLPTFPNWGIRMLMLLYPGLVLCGVRAVALGLTTTWLYIVMFVLAIVCLGYPTMLFVGQRYYRPRWIENEALVPKAVDLLSSKSKVKAKSARRKIVEARERVAEDAGFAVEGFFAKAMTPTGFYEVNHVDHVRFMASYLDYHGGLLFGSVLDNTFPLLYALCCLFPCPTNQVAGIFVTGFHAVYCLAFRPFVTIARVLVSLLVDIGCMIAIALLARDQEVQGTLTFQVVLIFVSWLNVVGYIWSFWRSERFRKAIRRRRRESRRSDKFSSSGPQTVGLKTTFLKVLENHLYHLHAMKPEVIARRNTRKRRMMMEDPSIVLESSTNSEVSEEELTTTTTAMAIQRGGGGGSPLPHRFAAAAGGAPQQGSPSPIAAVIPLTVIAPETKSDAPVSTSSHSTSKGGITSRLYRSTVSDNDSDENINEEEENKVRLDAPDANTDEAKARRAFGENRFKAYIKTPDGKAFGRSDADSVVKKLVVTADGVREVREWRDGTVQQQNEEMRKRTKVEADLKKLSATKVAMELEQAHRPVTVKAAKKDAEAIIEMTNRSRKYEDDATNRWEEAMIYEIKRAYRREGDTSNVLELEGTAGNSMEPKRETFLQRRMRMMGSSAPQGFDFDRGVDLTDV